VTFQVLDWLDSVFYFPLDTEIGGLSETSFPASHLTLYWKKL